MNSQSQWAFLTSPRFWALVIGAIALALYQDHIISQAWVTCVATIAGGFITVRTVDRLGEKIGSSNQPEINGVNQSEDQSEV